MILSRKDGFFLFDFSAVAPDGQPVWYLMAIPQVKSEPFLKAIEQEGNSVDLSAFGEVLASGYGEQPPEEVRREIKEKFQPNT